MPKIFISYRRDDSASAYASHAIYEKLAAHYGKHSVIFDVDTIPYGVDFVKYIETQVLECDALLAVIGDGWLDARSADGTRRLDSPRDLVRVEVQAALQREITVIPVLVAHASVPSEEHLPAELKALRTLNAAEVRSGQHYHDHLNRLVRGLDRAVAIKTSPPIPAPTGDEFVNAIGMRLRVIPAGEFLMGSPDSDADAPGNEKPQHVIRIRYPFYLGVYPVTQDEYEQVIGSRPSRVTGDGPRPVESLSWFEAIEFCNSLSKSDSLRSYCDIAGRKISILGGSGYRLPTEAEWEYACRAGTTTKWSCGDRVAQLPSFAWFRENSKHTQLLGQKPPNPWAYTICKGTYGSGAGTGMDRNITVNRRLKIPRGQRADRTVWTGAAVGATMPECAARRTAAGTSPRRAVSTWACEWPRSSLTVITAKYERPLGLGTLWYSCGKARYIRRDGSQSLRWYKAQIALPGRKDQCDDR